MTERFPFGPFTRPAPPFSLVSSASFGSAPGAVQGAKRRSVPLTARTDPGSCGTRGKGVFQPSRRDKLGRERPVRRSKSGM